MNLKPRYVFDTNAIISALLFGQSMPGKAFYTALDRGEFLVSRETAAELREVLGRKKFDRYVTQEMREQFLVMFVAKALVIEITQEVHACRDPKDDTFLELALSGQASYLITGDQDLLALHPFRGIPIVSPASFLELLSQESADAPNQPI
jgi:putative PIN family toxin of toxin-antitoxin system